MTQRDRGDPDRMFALLNHLEKGSRRSDLSETARRLQNPSGF